MELFSTRNTKLSQRSFNEASKISEILSGKSNEVSVIQESAMLNEENKLDGMFALAHNRKARDKRVLRMEKAKFFAENVEELLEHFLFNVVNEALLLDTDVKSLNKEYMTQKVSGVVGNLVKGGKFNKLPSATMKNIMESIEVHIDAMFAVKEDAEQVKVVRESYINDITGYVNYVSECVREKVAEVVKTEQKISTSINESTESVDVPDTLFKAIQIENVRQAMLEEQATEINDVVLAKAFCESLFEYTLIESLNTLRIVEFDAQQLRNGVGRFFKGVGVVNEAKKVKGKGIKIYTLKVGKDTTEVVFELLSSKEIMTRFYDKEGKETQRAVEIFFNTSVEDVEKEFKKVASEFKKEFRDARLASKNPTVKFFLQSKSDTKTRIKL
jgi:hypothetical protein